MNIKKTILGLWVPLAMLVGLGGYFCGNMNKILKEREGISNRPYTEIVYFYKKNIDDGLKKINKEINFYIQDRYLSDNEAEKIDEDVERLYKIVEKAPLVEENKEKLRYRIEDSGPGKLERSFSTSSSRGFRKFLKKNFGKEIIYKGLTDDDELNIGLLSLPIACLFGCGVYLSREALKRKR